MKIIDNDHYVHTCLILILLIIYSLLDGKFVRELIIAGENLIIIQDVSVHRPSSAVHTIFVTGFEKTLRMG